MWIGGVVDDPKDAIGLLDLGACAADAFLFNGVGGVAQAGGIDDVQG